MKNYIKNILLVATLFIVFTFGLQFFNVAFVNAAENRPIEDGVYVIKSALNKKYVLDIEGAKKTKGSNLELWENNGGDNQKFKVQYLGSGCYSISPKHCGKTLDVKGNSKKAGTNVQQWSKLNQNNQKWIIKSAGDGYYKIISKASKLCLDIPYSKANNGANVQVWTDNGGKNQMFKFSKASSSSSSSNSSISGTKTVEDGIYTIKTTLNDKYVVDVSGASKKDGANIQLWTSTSGNNQKFQFKYMNDGSYSITPTHSNKSMDVEGNQKKAGTNVLQWSSNNQNNQRWIVKDAGNGNYNIISKSSGLYLDVEYAKAEKGSNIHIWTSTGGNNQKFKLVKTGNSSNTSTANTSNGSQSVSNGIYTIKCVANNDVLDVADESMKDGGNILHWGSNGAINQKFTISYTGSGDYTISALHSGKYVDVEGASKSSGANVLQWSYNGDANQRWIIKDIGNGQYNIISKLSGMYLTVTTDNVCVQNANGSNYQKFKLDNSNKAPSIDTSKYPGYKEKVESLMKAHPNWHFEYLYTGLKFDSVIAGEYAVHSRNLVPTNYKGEWICSVCGTKLYDSGWYCASEKATAYYMDPRNFLDDTNVFQFLDVDQYIEGVCSIDGIQAQVNGTFLENYAKAIYNACRNKKVNAYYIISRLLQEQGRNGTKIGKGMDGGDGNTYYNPFNIGASGNGYDQIYANALASAKKYGWTSMQKAIEGGIDFCKKNWLDNYQNTLYQNKFDIDTRNGTSLYNHQYMQNLMAASSEANLLRGMYSSTNKLNSYCTFIIPVYERMPSSVSPMPKNTVELAPINVQVTSSSADVKESASDSAKTKKTVTNKDVILSVQRGINSTWHKVILTNGTVGYINGKYLKQIGDVKNCNYTAKVKTSDGSGCKVRVGPGTSSNVDVLTAITDGTTVRIIDKDRYNNIDGYNWCRVQLSDGRQGFMPIKFLV